MFEGFPRDHLATLLPRFDDFPEAYHRENFEALSRDIQFGPTTDRGQDFAHWSYLFDGTVFAGRGANPGLSEFCNTFVGHLEHVVRTQDHTKIENWYYRVRFLQAFHAKHRVPSLKPLQQIACALNEVNVHGRSADADLFARAVQELKNSWETGAHEMAKRISSSFLDGDKLLIIGHSKILEIAIAMARQSGTQVKVYLYCPGPDFSVGRFPDQCESEACPFVAAGGVPVLRDDAVNLIRANKIGKVLCATCAYTADRKMFWITVGGSTIGDAASVYGKPFMPVGGAYKQLRDDVAVGFIDDSASILVDRRTSRGSCNTRFLD